MSHPSFRAHRAVPGALLGLALGSAAATAAARADAHQLVHRAGLALADPEGRFRARGVRAHIRRGQRDAGGSPVLFTRQSGLSGRLVRMPLTVSAAVQIN